MDKDKSFASYKLAGSAGFIVGGIIAPIMYGYFGFFWSFMIYGIVVSALGSYAFLILPVDIKPRNPESEESEEDINDSEN